MSVLEHLKKICQSYQPELFTDLIPGYIEEHLVTFSDRDVMVYLSRYFGYTYNDEGIAQWLKDFEQYIIKNYV